MGSCASIDTKPSSPSKKNQTKRSNNDIMDSVVAIACMNIAYDFDCTNHQIFENNTICLDGDQGCCVDACFACCDVDCIGCFA